MSQKVDEVVDAVEDVVDVVEDVAKVVDDAADAIHKVSSDLADDLPNNSLLKGVATWVENASKEVSDGAEQTLDFIDKAMGLDSHGRRNFPNEEHVNQMDGSNQSLDLGEDFKEELEKKVDEVLDFVDDDESKEEKAVGSKKEAVAQVPLQKDEEHVKEEAATR
ncbi:hypothetical protein ACLOJK_013499 [Asimina triloba]